MPPKKFEGKFGIQPSHSVESELTSALYRLPESIGLQYIENLTHQIAEACNKRLEESYEERLLGNGDGKTNLKSLRSLSESQIKTLQLKLARHYEDNGDSAKIDVPTCIDAIVESPRFLDSPKGSIDKLFEMHEMKTLQKISELRKKRAEMSGNETYNPYENLFETANGEYYMARLLNMPHLEQESEYMDHCVGTSTSYVNKIKRGEVEILSFRDTETHNPVVTIEYDLKAKRLLQVKSESDDIPTLADEYASDLLEAFDTLSKTVNDQGQSRIVTNKALEHLKQLRLLGLKKRMDPLTRDELLFLYEVHEPIECFDEGRDPLIDHLLEQRDRQKDIQTLCDCSPEHIAYDFIDIIESTQVFCEDDGTKITFFDFREEKNKEKLPQLLDLAKSINASGSPARPDMAFGGIVSCAVIPEQSKSRATLEKSFEEVDGSTPSYIWDKWKNAPFIAPKSLSFETIVLSYNTDPKIRKSSDKILEDMDKLDLRPLTLEEITIAGISYPTFTKKDDRYFVGLTKYALGGFSYVPDLCLSGVVRGLVGSGWGGGWSDRGRFLCVRK